MGTNKITIDFQSIKEINNQNDTAIDLFIAAFLPVLLCKLASLPGWQVSLKVSTQLENKRKDLQDKKGKKLVFAQSIKYIKNKLPQLAQRDRNLFAIFVIGACLAIKSLDTVERFKLFHFEVPLAALTPPYQQVRWDTLLQSLESKPVTLQNTLPSGVQSLKHQTKRNHLDQSDVLKKNFFWLLPPDFVSIELKESDQLGREFLRGVISSKFNEKTELITDLKPQLDSRWRGFEIWPGAFMDLLPSIKERDATHLGQEWFISISELPFRLERWFNSQPAENFCDNLLNLGLDENLQRDSTNQIKSEELMSSSNHHISGSRFHLVDLDPYTFNKSRNQLFLKNNLPYYTPSFQQKREWEGTTSQFFPFTLMAAESDYFIGNMDEKNTVDTFDKKTVERSPINQYKQRKSVERLSFTYNTYKKLVHPSKRNVLSTSNKKVKKRTRKKIVQGPLIPVKRVIKVKASAANLNHAYRQNDLKTTKNPPFYRNQVYTRLYQFANRIRDWYFNMWCLDINRHQFDNDHCLTNSAPNQSVALRKYRFLPRRMSGYSYPDMSTNQLPFLFAKLNYQKGVQVFSVLPDEAFLFSPISANNRSNFYPIKNVKSIVKKGPFALPQNRAGRPVKGKIVSVMLPPSTWSSPSHSLNGLKQRHTQMRLNGHLKTQYSGFAARLNQKTKDVAFEKDATVREWTTFLLGQDNPLVGAERSNLFHSLREKWSPRRKLKQPLLFWKDKQRRQLGLPGNNRLFAGKTAKAFEPVFYIGVEKRQAARFRKRETRLHKRLKKRPVLPILQLTRGKGVSLLTRQEWKQIKEKIRPLLEKTVNKNKAELGKVISKISARRGKKVYFNRTKWPTLDRSLRLVLPIAPYPAQPVQPINTHLVRLDYQNKESSLISQLGSTMSFKSPLKENNKLTSWIKSELVNTDALDRKKSLLKKPSAIFLSDTTSLNDEKNISYGLESGTNGTPPHSEDMCIETSTEQHAIPGWYYRNFPLRFQGQTDIRIWKILDNILSNLFSFDSQYNEENFSFSRSHDFNFWEPVGSSSWLLLGQIAFWWGACQYIYFLDRQYHQESLRNIMNHLIQAGMLSPNEARELYFYEPKPTYRLFMEVESRLKDFVFTDRLMVELFEIIWFLRGRGRATLLSGVPKGVLLVGPPGTGKTLLVRSLAGESEVPVIVKSGSTLHNVHEGTKPALQLEQIFNKARELAPCLLFIDEIDSLGVARGSIYNAIGELVKLLTSWDFRLIQRNFYQDSLIEENNILVWELESINREGEDLAIEELADLFTQIGGHEYNGEISRGAKIKAFWVRSLVNAAARREARQKNLDLLSQFLVQMDGFTPRKGVVVFGATNRFEVLDPALLRPGRFGQVLYVPLPGKQRRVDILKLYTNRVGTQGHIPWIYLANRVTGWSAADIEAAINQSAIRATLDQTLHTLESIEYGFDLVASAGQLPKVDKRDTLFVGYRAYYQAGKAVAYSLLPNHPPAVVFWLWTRPKSVRQTTFANILQMPSMGMGERNAPYTVRKDVESRLVGLYAGKAGEVLGVALNSVLSPIENRRYSKRGSLFGHLVSRSPGSASLQLTQETSLRDVHVFEKEFNLNQEDKLTNQANSFFNKKSTKWKGMSALNFSPQGDDELKAASKLAVVMIEHWHFYSGVLLSQNRHPLETKWSEREYREYDYALFLEGIVEQLSEDIDPEAWEYLKSNYAMKGHDELRMPVWWSEEIAFPLKQRLFLPSTWWRFYLPNRDENRLNEQWVPPERYYQTNSKLVNVFSNSFIRNMSKTDIHTSSSLVTTDKTNMDNEQRIETPLENEQRIETPVEDDQKIDNEQKIETLLEDDQKNETTWNNAQRIKTILEDAQRNETTWNEAQKIATTWNELYGDGRDYLYHGLLMNSFGKALLLLENNRELLDYFAHYLVQHKILREDHINQMVAAFCPTYQKPLTDFKESINDQ